LGRLAGFGGAPNMGCDPHGRRHTSPPWLSLISGESSIQRGRKLVVQMVETYAKGGVPVFVESLDAVRVGKESGFPIAPVMIYGDDVTHVVTEEGIAYLYKSSSLEERRAALAAVAGVSPIGVKSDPKRVQKLRRDGLVAFPEDLQVSRNDAKRSLLAARSVEDLVAWSGNLYDPPAKFRSW
jgi:malonate decarboxylase alpha subunit